MSLKVARQVFAGLLGGAVAISMLAPTVAASPIRSDDDDLSPAPMQAIVCGIYETNSPMWQLISDAPGGSMFRSVLRIQAVSVGSPSRVTHQCEWSSGTFLKPASCTLFVEASRNGVRGMGHRCTCEVGCALLSNMVSSRLSSR